MHLFHCCPKKQKKPSTCWKLCILQHGHFIFRCKKMFQYKGYRRCSQWLQKNLLVCYIAISNLENCVTQLSSHSTYVNTFSVLLLDMILPCLYLFTLLKLSIQEKIECINELVILTINQQHRMMFSLQVLTAPLGGANSQISFTCTVLQFCNNYI